MREGGLKHRSGRFGRYRDTETEAQRVIDEDRKEELKRNRDSLGRGQ